MADIETPVTSGEQAARQRRIARKAATKRNAEAREAFVAASSGFVDADALHGLGNVALQSEDYGLALEHYESVLEADPIEFEHLFRVNATALMCLAQAVAPAMVAAGRGAIIVTGNTAAHRGRAAFSMFAPTKAAQRILAESMARSLGPQGVHVAYLAIDAVIDVPWTRKAMPDRPDSFFCQPSEIADEAWHIVHQPRSAWTFDVMIRPDAENW